MTPSKTKLLNGLSDFVKSLEGNEYQPYSHTISQSSIEIIKNLPWNFICYKGMEISVVGQLQAISYIMHHNANNMNSYSLKWFDLKGGIDFLRSTLENNSIAWTYYDDTSIRPWDSKYMTCDYTKNQFSFNVERPMLTSNSMRNLASQCENSQNNEHHKILAQKYYVLDNLLEVYEKMCNAKYKSNEALSLATYAAFKQAKFNFKINGGKIAGSDVEKNIARILNVMHLIDNAKNYEETNKLCTKSWNITNDLKYLVDVLYDNIEDGWSYSDTSQAAFDNLHEISQNNWEFIS